MNIKGFQSEAKTARKAVTDALKNCQELLWQMDRDGLRGQERMEAEQVIRIIERLKSAKEILSTR